MVMAKMDWELEANIKGLNMYLQDCVASYIMMTEISEYLG